MLGAAVGMSLNALIPGIDIPVAAFVLVGMAAVFSGAARTPISTLIMVGFLLLDMSAPLLEALLLGLTTGAIMVLYLSLFDLDYPFGGLWRVEPLGLQRLRHELHE